MGLECRTKEGTLARSKATLGGIMEIDIRLKKGPRQAGGHTGGL